MDRCTRATFKSKTHGNEIVTYRWDPSSETSPCGVIFAVHGLHSWTGQEFLTFSTNDTGEVSLHAYSGSIIDHWNKMGLIVYAHDHRGHGNSGGTPRAFFSVSELVQDTIQFIEETSDSGAIDGLPKFLLGLSMGGTLSILIGRKFPDDYFRGIILISPAVKEPDDSFGPLGRVLKAVSSLLNVVMPNAEVLKLPDPPVESIKTKWYADALTWHGKLRVRPGRTMVTAYQDIDRNLKAVTFPMYVIIGTEDTLVSPDGMREFVDHVSSKEKSLEVMPGMWHVLIDEPGGEKAIEKICGWIQSRL